MSNSGITSNGQRTIPVKFDITSPSGSFIFDPSGVVSVVDAAGHSYFSQACENHSQFYRVNINTVAIPAGTFSVVVSFNSDKLTGSFSAPFINSP